MRSVAEGGLDPNKDSRIGDLGVENAARPVLYDLESEQAVLGSMLLDGSSVPRVATILDPDDFLREVHQAIYSCMLALHGRGQAVDITTLRNELEVTGNYVRFGGEIQLIELINSTPTAIHAEHYARIVESWSVRRRIVRAAASIAIVGNRENDPDRLLEESQRILLAASRRRAVREAIPMDRMMDEFMTEAARRRSDPYLRERGPNSAVGSGSIPTGFLDMDRLLGGLHPSDFVIVAGRPGQGKSAIALSMAATAATTGVPVGVFSLEMGREQVTMRLVAAHAKVDVLKLRLGTLPESDWERAQQSSAVLAALPIYVDDTGLLTIDSLRQRALAMAYQYRIGLLVIDYLQLLSAPQSTGARGGSRTYEVGEISRTLKMLAKEMSLPVLACCQLNRGTEFRKDRKPTLANLRDTGQLEQDADVVLLLHKRESESDADSLLPDIVDVDVAKHRNGPVGEFPLLFRGQYARFDSMVRE